VQAAGGAHPLTARTRAASIYVLAAIIIGLDQITKAIAVSSLRPGVSEPVIEGVLHWTLYRNPGSAFGFLASVPALFTVLATGIAIAIIIVARRPHPRSTAFAMALLLGGAIGNLVDRVSRPPGFPNGHVIDFIDLRVWPVFNVADMAITCGALLIVVTSWIADRKAARTPAPPAPSDGPSSE
jgi:signal peptidase II